MMNTTAERNLPVWAPHYDDAPGPRYNVRVGSPFYRNLMHVLNEVNSTRVRVGQDPITFRESISAMGYNRDSVSGKLKSGVQVPANNKLEALADYLGVEPTVFDVYVQRFADEEMESGRMLDCFRTLMQVQDVKRRSVLSASLCQYAKDVAARL